MFTFNTNKYNQENVLKGDEFIPPPSTKNTNTYKQYNPLKDLPENAFYSAPKLYQIATNPELLFEDEANRGRTFTDNFVFYTGTSWVAGSILGGMKGTMEGIKAAERGDSIKIRVNRVLNTGGSVGRSVANRAALLGLLYSCVSDGIKFASDGVIHDDLGFVLGCVGTGACFRVFVGVRGAAVGGVVGGVLAGAFLGGRGLINRFGLKLGQKFEGFAQKF